MLSPMAANSLVHSIQTSLAEPLTPCQQAEPCEEGAKPACAWGRPGDGWPLWMRAFGFISFIGICGTIIYHSGSDPWATAFLLGSQNILILLAYALCDFETQPRGTPRRARAKAAAWALSTVLTLAFALRVAERMPLPAAVLVWVMAGSTVSAGFYMLFVCPDGAVAAEEESPQVADMA